MVERKRCRISVCTSCKSKGAGNTSGNTSGEKPWEKPGAALIHALRARLAEAPALAEVFDVAGVACMAGCAQPCTVGFHGVGKASYLFGDLEPGADVDDLITFARQYDLLQDGWCSSVDRPGKLRKSTLARVPATLFAHPEALPEEEITA